MVEGWGLGVGGWGMGVGWGLVSEASLNWWFRSVWCPARAFSVGKRVFCLGIAHNKALAGMLDAGGLTHAIRNSSSIF